MARHLARIDDAKYAICGVLLLLTRNKAANEASARNTDQIAQIVRYRT